MKEINSVWELFNSLTDEQLITLTLNNFQQLEMLCMLLTIEFELRKKDLN